MKKKYANNTEHNTKKRQKPVAAVHLSLSQEAVLAKKKRSIFCRQMAVLTLCFAVHAVGVASDVPYGLKSHGLVLTRQTGLSRLKEIHKQHVRSQ